MLDPLALSVNAEFFVSKTASLKKACNMKIEKESRIPWNKGYTKLTHPGVLKISKTLTAQPRSNFFLWQIQHRLSYPRLRKNNNLAEFYGLLLGDGCIEKVSRTEKISISCHSKEVKRVARIQKMMTSIFGKRASLRHRRESHCADVYLYQNHLSRRLDFPTGKKLLHKLRIPPWISQCHSHTLRCLKGLFETDGNLSIDRKNHTEVIKFTNWSQTLLDDVYQMLHKMRFHPQRRATDVRLARKKEVRQFVKLIEFSKA